MNHRILMEESNSAEEIARCQQIWMPDNLTPDEREEHAFSVGFDRGWDSVQEFNDHAGRWNDCEGEYMQDCWGYSQEEIECYRDSYCSGRCAHLDTKKGIRKYGSLKAYNRIMAINEILES
jgi:hypothetical protein